MTYHPARAVIDHAAIRHNVTRLREVAPAADVMAVVKADAYGHGLVPVARTALAAGATWLGVAQLGEALALRAAGVQAPLLTWLYSPGAPLGEAVEAGLDVSVSAPWALAELAEAARRTGTPARVHLKVDTGMSRGGVTPADLPALARAAATLVAEGVVDVVGVWSHLARADEPDEGTTGVQLARFHDAVRAVEGAGLAPRLRHLAASSAIFTAPATHLDLVRPGLALYGLSPIPDLADAATLGLRPAMRLEADAILVKDVDTATPVSYGHTYVTDAATRLAVLPVGYGDGIPRHASNRGPVLLGGRRVRVAGRVCMDQVVVDLGPGSDVAAGTTAVLFGDGTDGAPTAQDWADAAGTISYEIVSRLGDRVPRVHVNVREDADG
ncbi:alanine racemase [Georgenia faecalis]|uniref:alanine racemase n=1 Tax=Georgenia faecalis TaxID=2483799 RepID=UPI000FDC3A23|nr:alanine racemase [Georgenia faecalis]